MIDLESDLCEEVCEHPQLICSAQHALLSNEHAQQVAELFKMLGDATRVKILQTLLAREMCVCDIAATIGMAHSAVSHQLRLLRGTRLVKFRREGKNALYSLNDDHVESLLRQGMEHVFHG